MTRRTRRTKTTGRKPPKEVPVPVGQWPGRVAVQWASQVRAEAVGQRAAALAAEEELVERRAAAGQAEPFRLGVTMIALAERRAPMA